MEARVQFKVNSCGIFVNKLVFCKVSLASTSAFPVNIISPAVLFFLVVLFSLLLLFPLLVLLPLLVLFPV
jgi:hypothetical protein